MYSSYAKDGTVSNREEIADHVEGAFTGGPVSRADLIAHAEASDAPQRVVETLGHLPDTRFRHLYDLWPLLPQVPIEAET